MRFCPQCKASYSDDAQTCPRDGSALEPASVTNRPLEHTAALEPPKASGPPGTIDITGDDLGGASFSSQNAVQLTRAGRPGASHAGNRPGAKREGEELKNPEDRIGQTVGSYRLVDVIGRGGMGAVYRAEHVRLPGREVALKLLRADYAKREDSVGRFIREAQSVYRIQHRNIVGVHDIVESDTGPTFIVMELLEGDSLGKLLRRPGELTPARNLDLLIQTCDGLAAAHKQKIVHRDLKPDNIFVSRDEQGRDLVKLLDFGVAKLLSSHEGDVNVQTVAGAVIGTPAFMSPEQAGGMSIDARSDIYSLGAIMYELFTGSPPFKGKSFGEFVRKHLNEKPLPPSETKGGRDLDPRIEAIIVKCLEKNPAKRFPGALELREALVEIHAEHEPASAPAPAPAEPAERLSGSAQSSYGGAPGAGLAKEIAAEAPAPAALAEKIDPSAPGDVPLGTPPFQGELSQSGEHLPTPPPHTPSPFPGQVGEGPVSHATPSGAAPAASPAESVPHAAPGTPYADAGSGAYPPQAGVAAYAPSGEYSAQGYPIASRAESQPYPVQYQTALTPGRQVSGPYSAQRPAVSARGTETSWRRALVLMLGGGAAIGAIAGFAIFGFFGGGDDEAADPADQERVAAPPSSPIVTSHAPSQDDDGKHGTILIWSSPDNADVSAFRADEPICKTPCEFRPGAQGPRVRRYIVDKEGYKSALVEADLEDPERRYNVTLEPAD